MASDSYFDRFNTKLTQQQQNAIRCAQGPALVIAGAGSGKTSVIAHRFIYLVHHFKINPERILLVTFTNQAAKNIKSRINQYMCEWMVNSRGVNMPMPFENIQSMTFHAICKQILDWVYEHKDRDAAIKCVHSRYYTPALKVVMQEYPHIRAVSMVREILEHLRMRCKSQNRSFTEEDLVDVVMRLDDIYEKKKILDKYPMGDMREIYVKFDDEMKRRQLGTLDDIILNANNYLRFDEDVVREWKNRFDAILCDEFQDVDDLQFNVLTKLCSSNYNLFCVGDPDQAIYGFRGSLPQVFIKLKNYFDKRGIYTQIKKLEKNFRSTPQILAAANTLINSSQVNDELRKNLITDKWSGEMPKFEVFKSATLQSEAVVKKIDELREQGVRLSDIAILSRKKVNYNRIKNDLLFKSIQYEDYKETFSLLRGEAIKDIVGWISVAFVDPDSEQWFGHLKRIYNKPPSGIGAVAFQRIVDAARGSHNNIMEILGDLASQSDKFMRFVFKINQMKAIAKDETKGLKERYWEIAMKSGIVDYYENKHGVDSDKLDTISKFLDSPLVTKAKSWKDALEHVERYLDVTSSKNRVVCSTIHGVKGLEFKYVFIVSMSEGNIPTSRGLKLCKNSEQTEAYIDEERRVFYVAITRAKDYLYIYSDKEEISLFIKDIAGCLDGKIPVKASRGRPKKTKSQTEKSKKKETNTKKKTTIDDGIGYEYQISAWQRRVDELETELSRLNAYSGSYVLEHKRLQLKIAKANLKIVKAQNNISRWKQSMKTASADYKKLLKTKIENANTKILYAKRNIEIWEEYVRERR